MTDVMLSEEREEKEEETLGPLELQRDWLLFSHHLINSLWQSTDSCLLRVCKPGSGQVLFWPSVSLLMELTLISDS